MLSGSQGPRVEEHAIHGWLLRFGFGFASAVDWGKQFKRLDGPWWVALFRLVPLDNPPSMAGCFGVS